LGAETTTSSPTPPGASGTTTQTTAGATQATVSAAGTATLARTGASTRMLQLWAGVALALGGAMVLVAQPALASRHRRRRSSGLL
jgi:drug/metabolite transporter (DMT)-like permease